MVHANHLTVIDQQLESQCGIRCCMIVTIVKALVKSIYIAKKWISDIRVPCIASEDLIAMDFKLSEDGKEWDCSEAKRTSNLLSRLGGIRVAYYSCITVHEVYIINGKFIYYNFFASIF